MFGIIIGAAIFALDTIYTILFILTSCISCMRDALLDINIWSFVIQPSAIHCANDCPTNNNRPTLDRVTGERLSAGKINYHE